MRSIVRKPAAQKRRAGSHFALAIALATGSAVAVAGFAEPAYAQKKKKKGEDEKPQANYTKEFVESYQPLSKMVEGEGADLAAAKAGIPGMKALIQTDDDRMVAGNLIYNIGTKSQDYALQREGVAMMLESGKVPAEAQGQYNFLAAQLSYQINDYAGARTYGMKAIDLGYTQNSPEIFVAESYLQNNEAEAGLQFLAAAVENRINAGKEVDQSWIQRGLALSFNNKLPAYASKFGYWYAKYYPSENSWGDALAVLRNFNDFQPAETLDILRLTRKTNTFRTKYDYHEYIEAADPRRLPGEVVAVVDEGYGSGMLTRDDPFASEAYSLAQDRAKADRTDLPALERDANAAGAGLRTVVAAGDAFLSYSQPAKAEAFYNKALTLPGVDTPLVLTRIGIAQVEQGKYGEAEATFAKVQGAREAISRLWAAYAAQQVASSAPATTTAAAAPATDG